MASESLESKTFDRQLEKPICLSWTGLMSGAQFALLSFSRLECLKLPACFSCSTHYYTQLSKIILVIIINIIVLNITLTIDHRHHSKWPIFSCLAQNQKTGSCSHWQAKYIPLLCCASWTINHWRNWHGHISFPHLHGGIFLSWCIVNDRPQLEVDLKLGQCDRFSSWLAVSSRDCFVHMRAFGSFLFPHTSLHGTEPRFPQLIVSVVFFVVSSSAKVWGGEGAKPILALPGFRKSMDQSLLPRTPWLRFSWQGACSSCALCICKICIYVYVYD